MQAAVRQGPGLLRCPLFFLAVMQRSLGKKHIRDEASNNCSGNCHVDLILLSRHLKSYSCDPLLVLQRFIVSSLPNYSDYINID